MIVTWVTQNATSASVVEYGPVMLNAVAKGDQVKFVDGGPLKRAIYVHKVTLANLSPGQKYCKISNIFKKTIFDVTLSIYLSKGQSQIKLFFGYHHV